MSSIMTVHIKDKMGWNCLHELYQGARAVDNLLRGDCQSLLLHGDPFTCPQPPIALEHVADGLLLDTEIPLPFDAPAGIS
jgi:hypothetical protein